MKKIVYIGVVFIVCLCMMACNKNIKKEEKIEDVYKKYENLYLNIAKNYKPDNYKKIGEAELQHSATIFPENDVFEEKNDLIDEDFNKPRKRNLYYLSEKKNVVIYITHIFSEENQGKHLLSYDVPTQECKVKDAQIPYFQEYYMTYDNMFISFKVIQLNEDSDMEEINELADDAVQEYMKVLGQK